MSKNLRKIELAMYVLRKDWGLYADILCPCETTHDVTTGKIDRSWRRIPKIKAIILPFSSEYERPNKNITLQGVYDEDKRKAIILSSDLPKDFTITKQCHLQFKNKRWEISKLTNTEENSSWYLELNHLKNSELVYE